MSWTSWEPYRSRYPELENFVTGDISVKLRRYQYASAVLNTTDKEGVPTLWVGDVSLADPEGYNAELEFSPNYSGARVTVTVPAEAVDYHIATSGVTLSWAFQLDSAILHDTEGWVITTVGSLSTFEPTVQATYTNNGEAFVYHNGITQSMGYAPGPGWVACPAFLNGEIDPTNPTTLSWVGTLASVSYGGKFVWPRQQIVLTAGQSLTIDYYIEPDWPYVSSDSLLDRASVWTDLSISTLGTLEKTRLQVEVSYYAQVDDASTDSYRWASQYLKIPTGDPFSFNADSWGAGLVTLDFKRGSLVTASLDEMNTTFVVPATMSLSGLTGLWFGKDLSSGGLSLTESFGPKGVVSAYVIPPTSMTGSTGSALILPVLHVHGDTHASPGNIDYAYDGTQDCKGWVQVSQGTLATVVGRFDFTNDLTSKYRSEFSIWNNGTLSTIGAVPIALDYTKPAIVRTYLAVTKPREIEALGGMPCRLGFVLGVSGGAVESTTRQTSYYTFSDLDSLYDESRYCAPDFASAVEVSGGSISGYGYEDPTCWARLLTVSRAEFTCGEALTYPLYSFYEDDYGAWLHRTVWMIPGGIEGKDIRVDILPSSLCTNPNMSGFSYEVLVHSYWEDPSVDNLTSESVNLTPMGTYTGVFDPLTPLASLTISNTFEPWHPIVLETRVLSRCPRATSLQPFFKLQVLPDLALDHQPRAQSMTRKFITVLGNLGGNEWATLADNSTLRYITDKNLPFDHVRSTASTLGEYLSSDNFLRFNSFSVEDGLIVADSNRTQGFDGLDAITVTEELVSTLSEPTDSVVTIFTHFDETMLGLDLSSLGKILAITTGDPWIPKNLTASNADVLEISDWSDPSILEWIVSRIPGYDIFKWIGEYTYLCGECPDVPCIEDFNLPVQNAVGVDYDKIVTEPCVLHGTLTDGFNPISGAIITISHQGEAFSQRLYTGTSDSNGSFTICLPTGLVGSTISWSCSPWHAYQEASISSMVCPPLAIELVARPWVGTAGVVSTASYELGTGLSREYHPISTEHMPGDYGWTYWCTGGSYLEQVTQATLSIVPTGLTVPGVVTVWQRSQDREYRLGTLFTGTLATTGVEVSLPIEGRWAPDDNFPLEILAYEPTTDWTKLPVYSAITGLTAYPNQDIPVGEVTLDVSRPGIYELCPGLTASTTGVWFQAKVQNWSSTGQTYLVLSNTVPTAIPSISTIESPIRGYYINSLDDEQVGIQLGGSNQWVIDPYARFYRIPGQPSLDLLLQCVEPSLQRCFIVTAGYPLATINVTVDMELVSNQCNYPVVTENEVAEGWLYQYASVPLSGFSIATQPCLDWTVQITTFERSISLGDDTKWIDLGWVDPAMPFMDSWSAFDIDHYQLQIQGVRTPSDCFGNFTWYGSCTPSTVSCVTVNTFPVTLDFAVQMATLSTSTYLDRKSYAIADDDPQTGEDGSLLVIETPAVGAGVSHYCFYISSELGSATLARPQILLESTEPFSTSGAWGHVIARTMTGITTLATFDFLTTEPVLSPWSLLVEPTAATWPFPMPSTPRLYTGNSYVLGFPEAQVPITGAMRIEAWVYNSCGASVSWKINPGIELPYAGPAEFLFEDYTFGLDTCCTSLPTQATVDWVGGVCNSVLQRSEHGVTNQLETTVGSGYSHIQLTRSYGSPVQVTPALYADSLDDTVRLYNTSTIVVVDGVTLATCLYTSTLASAATVSTGLITTLSPFTLGTNSTVDLYVFRPCAPAGYEWEARLSLGTAATMHFCEDRWWLGCNIGELVSIETDPEIILEQLGTTLVAVEPTFNGCGVSSVLYRADVPVGVTSTEVETLGTGLLTFAADTTVAPGLYTVDFSAYASSTVVTTSLLRVVRPGGDWEITATPTLTTVIPGDYVNGEVALHRWNYTEAIVLSSVCPDGLSVEFSGTSFTIAVGDVTPGLHTITLISTSQGDVRTTYVQIYAQDQGFGLQVYPDILRFEVDDYGEANVSAMRYGGFMGDITLDGSPLPTSFSPEVIGTSSVMQVSGLTPGTYSLEVIGTSGALTEATSITVEIYPVGALAHFHIFSDPTSLFLAPSDTGVARIWIERDDLTGLCNLSASSAGSLSFLFSDNPVDADSILSISSYQTPPGIYTVTIDGAIGSKTASHNLQVEVTNDLADYWLSFTPDVVSTFTNTTTSATIEVFPIKGWSGVIAPTISLPSGITGEFVPATFATSSVLYLYVGNVDLGAYALQVTDGTKSTSLELNVIDRIPLFSISAENCITLGSPLSIDITLHQMPMDSFVFSTAGLPTGITSSFSPPSRRQTTIILTGDYTPGIYPFNVIAQSEGSLATCTLNLHIPDEGVSEDFFLVASPAGLVIQDGWTGYADIFLSTIGGWDHSVVFSSPEALIETPVSKTGTRVFVEGTTPGRSNVRIDASRGGDTRSLYLPVDVVTSAPNFTVYVTPTKLIEGAYSTNEVSLSLATCNGFSGPVSLRAWSDDTSIDVSVPDTLTDEATLGIVLYDTSPGLHTISVESESQGLIRRCFVELQIVGALNDPFFTPIVPTVRLPRTGTVNVPLSYLPHGGFTGSVSYTLATLPTGVSCTVTNGVARLTSINAAVGNYVLPVLGISSSYSSNAEGSLTVSDEVEDFDLQLLDSTLVCRRGDSIEGYNGITARTQLSLTQYGGFNETVDLTQVAAPFLGSVWLSSDALTTSVTLNIYVDSGAVPGTYYVSTVGSLNGASRYSYLTVVVLPMDPVDFGISVEPSLIVGSTLATLSVAVDQLGGFAGTVAFGTSLTPATVSFNPIQSKTASELSLGYNLVDGDYDLEITGSYGGSIRSGWSKLLVGDGASSWFSFWTDTIEARKGDRVYIPFDVNHYGLHTLDVSFSGTIDFANTIIATSPQLVMDLKDDLAPGFYSTTLEITDQIQSYEHKLSILISDGEQRQIAPCFRPTNTYTWAGSVVTIKYDYIRFAGIVGDPTIGLTLPAGFSGTATQDSILLSVSTLATSGLYLPQVQFDLGMASWTSSVPVVVLPSQLRPTYSLRLNPTQVDAYSTDYETQDIDQYFFNGFDAPAVISTTGLPTGATLDNGTWDIEGYSLALLTLQDVEVGDYAYKVKGLASSQVKEANAYLRVFEDPADFYLESTPGYLELFPGEQDSVEVSVVPIAGFDQDVELTLTSADAGLTAVISGSTVTIRVVSSATIGSKNVTITGTSGAKIHVLKIQVLVQSGPARFGLELTNQTIDPCSVNEIPVTIRRYNGFSGAVSLTMNCEGALGTFLPNPVSLDIATLTLQPRKVPAGVYPMEVTGSVGGLVVTETVDITVSESENVLWVHFDNGRNNVPNILVDLGEYGTGITDADGWVPFCITPEPGVKLDDIVIKWSGDWHYPETSVLPEQHTLKVIGLPDEVHLHARPLVYDRGLRYQGPWESLAEFDLVPESRPKVHWPVFYGTVEHPLYYNAQIIAATLHIVGDYDTFAEVGKDAAKLSVWQRSVGGGADPIVDDVFPARWRLSLISTSTITPTALTVSINVTDRIGGLLNLTDIAFEIGAEFPIQDPNYTHDQIKAMMFDPGPAYGSFQAWNKNTNSYDLIGSQNIELDYYGPMEDRWFSGAYPEGFHHGHAIKVGTFGDAPEGTPDWANYPELVTSSTASSMQAGPIGSAPRFAYESPVFGGATWGTYCGNPDPPSRLDGWEGTHPGRYLAWPEFHLFPVAGECYPRYGDYVSMSTTTPVIDQFPFLWSKFYIEKVRPGHRYFFVAQQPAGYWANNMPPGGGVAYNIWSQVVPTAADILLSTGVTLATIAAVSSIRDFNPWTCQSRDPRFPTGQLPTYDGIQISNMEERTHCELSVPWRTHAPDALLCCDSSTLVPESDFTFEELQTGMVRYGPAAECGIEDTSYAGRGWLRDWMVCELTDYAEDNSTFQAVAMDPKDSAGGWDYVARWNRWVGEARWITVGPEQLPCQAYIEVEWHYWPCHYPMEVKEGSWYFWEDQEDLTYTIEDRVASFSYNIQNGELLSQVGGATLHIAPSDTVPASVTLWKDDVIYSGNLPSEGIDIPVEELGEAYATGDISFYATITRDPLDWSELPYYGVAGENPDVTEPGRYVVLQGDQWTGYVGSLATQVPFHLSEERAGYKYYLLVSYGTGATLYLDTTTITAATTELTNVQGYHSLSLKMSSIYAEFQDIVWVTEGPVDVQVDTTLSIWGRTIRRPEGDTYVSHFVDDGYDYYVSNVPLAGIEVESNNTVSVQLLDRTEWLDLRNVDPNEMTLYNQKWDSKERWFGPGETYYPIATEAIRWPTQSDAPKITWLGSCTEPPTKDGSDGVPFSGLASTGLPGPIFDPVYQTGLAPGVSGSAAFINHGLAAVLTGQQEAVLSLTVPVTPEGIAAQERQTEILIGIAQSQAMLGNTEASERLIEQIRANLRASGLSDSSYYKGWSGANFSKIGELTLRSNELPIESPITDRPNSEETGLVGSDINRATNQGGFDTIQLPTARDQQSQVNAGAVEAERMGEQDSQQGQSRGNVLNRMWNFITQVANPRTSSKIADQVSAVPAPPRKGSRHTNKPAVDRATPIGDQVFGGESWRNRPSLSKGEKLFQDPLSKLVGSTLESMVSSVQGPTTETGLQAGASAVDPGSRNIGPAIGLSRSYMPQLDELRRMKSMAPGPLSVQLSIESGGYDADVVNQELKRRL